MIKIITDKELNIGDIITYDFYFGQFLEIVSELDEKTYECKQSLGGEVLSKDWFKSTVFYTAFDNKGAQRLKGLLEFKILNIKIDETLKKRMG